MSLIDWWGFACRGETSDAGLKLSKDDQARCDATSAKGIFVRLAWVVFGMSEVSVLVA